MTLISSFPEGLGNALGDSLGVNGPFLSTGNVWYVHHDGTNGSAPAGRNRAKPLSTLAQAQANAADGDTIVLLDGHAQTFTANLSLTKALTIIGEGESGGKPTVKLTNNSASDELLTISAVCEIRNVWFEENLQANGTARVVANTQCRFVGCYFECGPFDETEALTVASSNITLRNCTFVSTATDTADQPFAAIAAAGTCNGFYALGLTLDGGTVGFSNFWAMDLSGGTFAATSPGLIEDLTLLRGADVLIPEEGHVKVVGTTVTGGGVIDWNGEPGV